MSNYVIGIGGSGIRILRAIIHNCVAGVIDIDEINMLAIDADWDSIVWSTLYQEYKEYNDAREVALKEKETLSFFHTKIKLMNGDTVITPIEYEKGNKTLEMSVPSGEKLERIMKFFYTKEEREKDLKEGFFARPAIGCVYFSNFQDNVFNTFLSKLEEDIKDETQTNVVLAGSIFGGTGASGLPTIIKLIEEKIQNATQGDVAKKAIDYLNMGAVFMLPYFKATNYSEEKALIKMQNFWKTSKEAMEYFVEEEYLVSNKYQWSRSLQRLYLINKEELDVVNFYAEGGKKQDNKPHIAEQYGALAIRDFLLETSKENFNKNLGITEWKVENEIDWNSLYFEKIEDEKGVRDRMGEFAQFAAIYHACIYRHIVETSRRRGNPQWYKTYIQTKSEEVSKQLASVNACCINYLRWIFYMQANLEIKNGEKEYEFNKHIELFGTVLEEIYRLIDIEPEKEKDKTVIEIIKKVTDSLEKIVSVGNDAGVILKKTVKILSMLSTYGVFNGMNGVPQLIADLCEIVQ